MCYLVIYVTIKTTSIHIMLFLAYDNLNFPILLAKDNGNNVVKVKLLYCQPIEKLACGSSQ